MSTDEQKLEWYRRRCKALEDLLTVYRIGGRPSERVFTELERTGQHIDHGGHWREDTAEVAR